MKNFNTNSKSVQQSKFTDQSPWEAISQFGGQEILRILWSLNILYSIKNGRL
jgi:hypothetical protein